MLFTLLASRQAGVTSLNDVTGGAACRKRGNAVADALGGDWLVGQMDLRATERGFASSPCDAVCRAVRAGFSALAAPSLPPKDVMHSRRRIYRILGRLRPVAMSVCRTRHDHIDSDTAGSTLMSTE